MKIIEKTTEFELTEDTAVAIGKFDGFHMGHQKLLHMVTEQKANGLAAAVSTFVPSPAAFFSKEAQQELTTIQEKRNIFEEAGVDYLIEYPFYQEIADMEPETYIRKVLVEQLHAKCIVAGEDVSFGKKGMGNYRLLEQKSAEYGYQVIVIDKVQYQGREISSTYVRDAVKQGEMELVTKLLGQPYHVGGTIVHGRHLGTGLGMPTVNILPPPEKLLPPNGVYYSYVMMNGSSFPVSFRRIRFSLPFSICCLYLGFLCSSQSIAYNSQSFIFSDTVISVINKAIRIVTTQPIIMAF